MSKKVPRIAKKCKVCGKIMQVRACRLERTKYCSRRCQGLDKIDHVNKVRPTPKANSGSFKAGEHVGRNSPSWIEPTKFICEYCGQLFYKKPWQIRHKDFSGRYCSTKCRNEYRRAFESGPNSPFWVGGPQSYRGRAWQEIRIKVVESQVGICAKCGVYVGPSLPVHHIKPFRDFDSAELANQRDNLIGLCQSCHMKADAIAHHSKPGNPG